MKLKEKIKAVFCVLISLCVVTVALFCVSKRASACFRFADDTAMVAAFLAMPDGDFFVKEKEQQPKKVKKALDLPHEQKQEKVLSDNTKNRNEATYPINEIDLSTGGFSYDNFSINNSTSYDMNVDKLLKSELPFEFKDTRETQVLIVHTHTCESYMNDDCGYYYESFYPRTTNNEKNVYAVGEAIAQGLKENGIGVVHASSQHDYPSYDGAYSRSYDTIMNYIDKYKEIKVVLDIHRDSMTQDDMTRLKPTFTYKGKKAAQIMIMTGHDDGSGGFPMWEDNLSFALKLQSKCESMYEGMTRPLKFGDFTYNMNVNSGSLLIEVGTDANTLSEAVRSGKMLGNALSEVLQKS